ncbi:hypothetical protein DL766_005561 [Monosporascus sp. MC13-8B]|uniref:CHAT domain-containing protein n=1 Tax=Monosporascus cannonballus TaxID=155416 RepID=A0ABY0H7L0_9PEZI|nr:hypothetical protein DL762_004516 [Monosporascus cannonballus]RYO94722.1 hypothetical protein DL763_003996 [Monosporascus cannonballus]RYP29034.1 hypothetical protein DL766_005561 [Monosporascus sp. MC13-8B]
MDELDTNLANVTLSSDSEKSARDALIEKADRERDLGCFNKALALYREAEAQEGDLSISIKIAGLLAEQGRTPAAVREWDQALDKYALTEEDEELLAVAELSRAICAGAMNCRFRPALEKGLKYFEDCVKPFPLAIVLLLETAYSTLRICGVQVGDLPWDQATVQDLYEELIQCEMFDKAYHVAQFPNSGKIKSEMHDLTLLDDLMAQPKLPALTHAHILQWKGTLAFESQDFDSWVSYLEEADALFRGEGHQLGPLWSELEHIHDDPRKKLQYIELKSAIIRIKDAFEKLGCWGGAKNCMLKLATMAVENADIEMLQQLNHEYEQIRHDCMSTIDWTDKEELVLRRWDYQEHHAAKLIKSFEELFGIFQDSDMPLRAATVATNLYELYKKIGDNQKAELWASRFAEYTEFHSQPTLYIFHPLIRRLVTKSDDSARLPFTEEVAQLSNFLTDKKTRYAENIATFERTQIIQSIFYLRALYSDRPFSQYKELSLMCFDAVRTLLPLLPTGERATIEAHLLEYIGILRNQEAWRSFPPAIESLIESYNCHADAAGILESLERGGAALSTAYAGMGWAAQSLWFAESSTANRGAVDDLLFLEADDYFRRSLDIAAEERSLALVQLGTSRLQSLWLDGLRFTMESKGKDDHTANLALNQACAWLDTGKQHLEASRRDYSTLTKSSAMSGKQSTRAALTATTLYKNAFGLAFCIERPRYLWSWVQDSKARSVSDILALGANIPSTLREAIDRTPSTKELFDEETDLRGRLDTAEGASKVMLHEQLDALRGRMSQDELADAVLALREGRPTTIEALQTIAQKDSELLSVDGPMKTCLRSEEFGLRRSEARRRVFFVDYGFHQDSGFVLVAFGNTVNFSWTKVSVHEAAKWKSDWLAHQEPETPLSAAQADQDPYSPRLLDGEDAALTWLSRLVQPLVEISKPGDLLVICPSESLHGIPLHAAKISGEGEKPTYFIERNPIVYTASMTVTEQCMVRVTSHTSSPGDTTSDSIVGVYRHPQPIRGMATRISQQFSRPFNIEVDRQISKTVVQDAWAKSKTALFFGHCGPGSRPAEQHLLLNDFHLEMRQLPRPEELFTVEDVFSTKISASLITLVACSSAAQFIRTGDEPVGLLAALLCSGANSVVGSMWPVESRTGVAFAEAFYKRIATLVKSKTSLEAEIAVRRDSDMRRTMIDLAVVLQETIAELRRSQRPGFDTRSVIHWGAFTLNGAWLLNMPHVASAPNPGGNQVLS